MSQDQRRHSRAEQNVAVIYYFDDESQARRIEEATLTVDLSGGGISMEVSQALEKGVSLHLKLLLKKQAVQCRGRVAYVGEAEGGRWRVGVELELTSEQQTLLENYVAGS